MEVAATGSTTLDSLRPPGRGIVPSWIVSTAVHVGLLFLLSVWLRPVAPRGSGTEELRTVGIYTRGDAVDSGGSGAPTEADSADGLDAVAAEPALKAVEEPAESSRLPVEDSPPMTLDLPVPEVPRIGPGSAGSAPGVSGDARDLLRGSARKGRADGGTGTGEGRVAFFGKGQEGRRFVFVLDASGSMYEQDAIRVAKTELLSSISQIGETQEFQVVFYNEQVFPMPTTGQRSSMFRGSEASRNLAAQHVRSVHPAGGTEHKAALLEALKFRPDVVFFLTDAGEPWMDAGDLEEIRRRNSGRCRICVVEFGKGTRLGPQDGFWTRRLARDNGGTYAYQDITNFGSARQ